MHVKQLWPLAAAAAALVTAQDAGQSGQSVSLSEALASQNSSLSMLNDLLQQYPDLVQQLSDAKNVTVLAPNNDALTEYMNSGSASTDAGDITALLMYHVLNGTFFASNLTEMGENDIISTMLTNETYTNVTDGQVVQVTSDNKNVTFVSGLGRMSNVTQANVNYTGGTIHIINTVLMVPLNDTVTLTEANLTALNGALAQANQAQNISDAKDVTIFAPSNEAFNAIGNLATNLSTDQLTSILSYHVVVGNVLYSSEIASGSSVRASNGEDLKITVEDGEVYVNSAKVIQPDVLVANGVVHVIDNVLNPQNTTATPVPSASTQAPAFSGAATTTGIPFTSGQTTPTSTAPIATHSSTKTSEGLGVPMKTGAIGVAALFGGAALFANM